MSITQAEIASNLQNAKPIENTVYFVRNGVTPALCFTVRFQNSKITRGVS